MNDQLRAVVFLGNTLEVIRDVPADPKQQMGHQVHRLQCGLEPDDWKPMKTVGPGVNEVRIKCNDGAFRVFYVVNRPEAIYVLHVFRKTTQKTEKRDIDLARSRLKELGSN